MKFVIYKDAYRDQFGGVQIQNLKISQEYSLTIMSKKEISIHFHSLSLSYKSTEFKANMIKLLISSCLHYRDFFFAHRNHTAKVNIQQSRHQSLFETMVIKVKFNSNQPKLIHSSNEKLVCTAIFIRGGRQEAAIHLGQQNTQPSRDLL